VRADERRQPSVDSDRASITANAPFVTQPTPLVPAAALRCVR